jgi:pyruvate-formate lyase
MDPTWINAPLLNSIVAAFVRQGGQIFQGNMTSVEDLRRAFDDPHAYPNLIVRVGGFSARFVNLDRSLQVEIVERYRHAV